VEGHAPRGGAMRMTYSVRFLEAWSAAPFRKAQFEELLSTSGNTSTRSYAFIEARISYNIGQIAIIKDRKFATVLLLVIQFWTECTSLSYLIRKHERDSFTSVQADTVGLRDCLDYNRCARCTRFIRLWDCKNDG
jgi:hypothetical protein